MSEQEQLDMFNMMQMGMNGGYDSYGGSGGYDYNMAGGNLNVFSMGQGGYDPFGGFGGPDPYAAMGAGGFNNYGGFGGYDPFGGGNDPFNAMFNQGFGSNMNANTGGFDFGQFDYYGSMGINQQPMGNTGPVPDQGPQPTTNYAQPVDPYFNGPVPTDTPNIQSNFGQPDPYANTGPTPQPQDFGMGFQQPDYGNNPNPPMMDPYGNNPNPPMIDLNDPFGQAFGQPQNGFFQGGGQVDPYGQNQGGYTYNPQFGF